MDSSKVDSELNTFTSINWQNLPSIGNQCNTSICCLRYETFPPAVTKNILTYFTTFASYFLVLGLVCHIMLSIHHQNMFELTHYKSIYSELFSELVFSLLKLRLNFFSTLPGLLVSIFIEYTS